MKLDIASIRARAEAATMADWEAFRNAWDRATVYGDVGKTSVVCELRDWAETEDDGVRTTLMADAEFIAAARTDVPRLCDRVEELEAALARLLDVSEARFILVDELPGNSLLLAWKAARAALGGGES